jgi:hypothetical protein
LKKLIFIFIFISCVIYSYELNINYSQQTLQYTYHLYIYPVESEIYYKFNFNSIKGELKTNNLLFSVEYLLDYKNKEVYDKDWFLKELQGDDRAGISRFKFYSLKSGYFINNNILLYLKYNFYKIPLYDNNILAMCHTIREINLGLSFNTKFEIFRNLFFNLSIAPYFNTVITTDYHMIDNGELTLIYFGPGLFGELKLEYNLFKSFYINLGISGSYSVIETKRLDSPPYYSNQDILSQVTEKNWVYNIMFRQIIFIYGWFVGISYKF